jgi:hypothetical protein
VVCGDKLDPGTSDPQEAVNLLRLSGGRRCLLGEQWAYFCPRCK